MLPTGLGSVLLVVMFVAHCLFFKQLGQDTFLPVGGKCWRQYIYLFIGVMPYIDIWLSFNIVGVGNFNLKAVK